jgi:hypothetical protein
MERINCLYYPGIDKYHNNMVEQEYFIGIFDNNISLIKRIYECSVK